MSWDVEVVLAPRSIDVHSSGRVTDLAAAVIIQKVFNLFRDCIQSELPESDIEVLCRSDRKTALCWMRADGEESCDINLVTFYDDNADDLIMTPGDLRHHLRVLIAQRNSINGRIDAATKLLEEFS